MTATQSFEIGYPWGWLNDPRDLYILTASEPDNGQSVVFNDDGSNIVNPPYARIALQFEVSGNTCQTPWLPMTVSPLLLPTPNQVRREYRLLVQPRQGITIDIEQFDRGDFDRIN